MSGEVRVCIVDVAPVRAEPDDSSEQVTQVVEGERTRRRVLGFPPFGGVAELSGDPAAVASACDALASAPVRVLGPVDSGTRALVRAATTDELCNALADPALDAARRVGRLRVDVGPRRI